jgi:hypothetical protein
MTSRLTATVVVLLITSSLTTAHAAPPSDIREFCAATTASPGARDACIRSEQDAKDRAERARQSFTGTDAATWNACYGRAATWSSLRQCLVNPAVQLQPRRSGGLVDSLNRAAESTRGLANSMRELGDATRAAGEAARTAAPDLERIETVAPSSPAPSPPSVIYLGPQTPPPASESPDTSPARPSIPIPQAEADRQARDAMERAGDREAKCVKRQYGSGWVTVCE